MFSLLKGMAECVVNICPAKPKRKRTVLSIEDKVAIIKQLDKSSAKVIAKRYGVGKSMISDISTYDTCMYNTCM